MDPIAAPQASGANQNNGTNLNKSIDDEDKLTNESVKKSNCELKGVNRGLSNVDHTDLRLLVRRSEAGALIGKRGSNIKRLRETFKTSKISIPDTGNGPERIVCLSIDKPDFDNFLTDLTNVLQEKSFEESGQIEIKLLIHSSHAGSLIGIAGQSIKRLRNDSKAAIKIYEMCCPLSSERVCAIKSKPPVVVRTIKLILDILKDNPVKGTIKLYDALNFDLSLADKYGGCLDDCLANQPGDCLSATSSGFVARCSANQTNLWMKTSLTHLVNPGHFPCRPDWCSTSSNPNTATQLGAALCNALGNHPEQQIITEPMPLQVNPAVYQIRASSRQTNPIAAAAVAAKNLSILNQSLQCHDNCQMRPLISGFSRANPIRMPMNSNRMQSVYRPQLAQRFHPYLQGRYTDIKNYQQARPWNNQIPKVRQQSFGCPTAIMSVAGRPNQMAPQTNQITAIQQIATSTNDIPQTAPIGMDLNMRVETEMASIESQSEFSGPKYRSETGNFTCTTTTCTGNNASQLDHAKEFSDVVAEKLIENGTMSSNGCHDATQNRLPESSQ